MRAGKKTKEGINCNRRKSYEDIAQDGLGGGEKKGLLSQNN